MSAPFPVAASREILEVRVGGGAVSGGNSDAFLASITFVIWGVSMSYLDRCFLINHFYLKFISKATFI